MSNRTRVRRAFCSSAALGTWVFAEGKLASWAIFNSLTLANWRRKDASQRIGALPERAGAPSLSSSRRNLCLQHQRQPFSAIPGINAFAQQREFSALRDKRSTRQNVVAAHGSGRDTRDSDYRAKPGKVHCRFYFPVACCSNIAAITNAVIPEIES